MVKIFKALSDETRLKILELLVNKSLNMTEIHNNFSISKPSISKHLDILKNANLVSVKKEGQYNIYKLNEDFLKNELNSFLTLFNK